MSEFFINRPIFASVISIVIVIAGAVSFTSLPVAKFPEVSPPTIQVSAVYPGANAQVIAETVATAIEQEVNGVENMLYMSSTSANDGSYTLQITFALGTDMDMANVMVQNRVGNRHAQTAGRSSAARDHDDETVDADSANDQLDFGSGGYGPSVFEQLRAQSLRTN